jgi:ribosomal protein S18 acetylase RimI-like enzyme
MNYRLATSKDLPSIVSFFKLVDTDFVPPLSKRGGDIEKFTKSLFEHGEKFLLLEKKKRIIGILSFSESQKKDACAHISYLVIHPSYRDKCLGRNLLNECFNILIGDKASNVLLETWSTNKKALDLYKKEGFELKKILKCDRGDKSDTIVLEEPLEKIHIIKK